MDNFVNPGDEIKAEQINELSERTTSADLMAQTANNAITQISSTVETAKGAFISGFFDTQDPVNLSFATVNGDVVQVDLSELLQLIVAMVQQG